MRVIRNILALLANQVGSWLVTFVITLVVPSYLGASVYGLYSFAYSYIGFFALGMQLGIGTYLTWRIAREPEMATRLTFNALIMQIPLGITCVAAALLVLPAVDANPTTFMLVVLIAISTALGTLNTTCGAALAGFQIMRVPAFINLFTSASGALLILLAIYFKVGLLPFAAAGILSQSVGLIFFLAYTHKKIGLVPKLDLPLWRTIVLGGLPFFTWSAVLLFYWQVDVTMLKVLVNDTVVGWYAAANRLISIPIFLPTIVVAAILPALSHERSATSLRFRELASRSIRVVALVGIPAAAGMILLASNLFRLLHFPQDFDPGIPLLVILSLNIPLVAIDMVLATVVIALGRQKAWTCVGLIAAVVNPLINLWAIPFTQERFANGAIGAAAVTVFTEFIMFSGAMYLRPRTIFTRWDIWYIVRCLLGAGVMVPAVWALSSLVGIVPAVAYGFVIYALAAYTLQLFGKQDIDALLRAVTSKLGISDLSQVPELARGALGRIPLRLRKTSRRVAAVGSLSALTPEELDISAAATEFLAAVVPTPSWAAATPVGNIDSAPSFMYDSGSRAALATLERADAIAPVPTQEPWVSVVYGDETEVDDQLRETMPIRAVTGSHAAVSANRSAQGSRRKQNPSQPTRTGSKRSGSSSNHRRRGR
jgi:O-antigen/teichoic acid export membrane protein